MRKKNLMVFPIIFGVLSLSLLPGGCFQVGGGAPETPKAEESSASDPSSQGSGSNGTSSSVSNSSGGGSTRALDAFPELKKQYEDTEKALKEALGGGNSLVDKGVQDYLEAVKKENNYNAAQKAFAKTPVCQKAIQQEKFQEKYLAPLGLQFWLSMQWLRAQLLTQFADKIDSYRAATESALAKQICEKFKDTKGVSGACLKIRELVLTTKDHHLVDDLVSGAGSGPSKAYLPYWIGQYFVPSGSALEKIFASPAGELNGNIISEHLREINDGASEPNLGRSFKTLFAWTRQDFREVWGRGIKTQLEQLRTLISASSKDADALTLVQDLINKIDEIVKVSEELDAPLAEIFETWPAAEAVKKYAEKQGYGNPTTGWEALKLIAEKEKKDDLFGSGSLVEKGGLTSSHLQLSFSSAVNTLKSAEKVKSESVAGDIADLKEQLSVLERQKTWLKGNISESVRQQILGLDKFSNSLGAIYKSSKIGQMSF